MKRYLILSLVFIGLCSACGPRIVYEQTHTCDPSGWTYADSLVAEFDIVDTNQIYNLHLRLTHGVDFPYQNFYVKVHTIFPAGERLSQEVSLEVARSSGAWYGDCDAESCVLNIPIQERAYFNQTGLHRLVVEQFSRDNPLSEMKSVGFALEETDDKRVK